VGRRVRLETVRIVIKCSPELKEEWERFKHAKRMTGEQALEYLLEFYRSHAENVEVFGNG